MSPIAEDEQHPPVPRAGQSEVLSYDEPESDESDYFQESESSDSGVSVDGGDKEVFSYDEGHSSSLLCDILGLGRANLFFLGNYRQFFAYVSRKRFEKSKSHKIVKGRKN